MTHNITISNSNKQLKEDLKELAKEEGLTLTTYAILQFKKAIEKRKREQGRE